MIEEIKSFGERKEEIIKKGKEKGFITYEELANGLKGLDIDSDSLDDLYNSLIYKDEVEFSGFVFSIFPKENRLPTYIGRTDAGYYQFAIDIDLIYTK